MKYSSIVVLLLPILLKSAPALAQPCYGGFNYRVAVVVNNTASPQLKDFQIKIQLNTQSLIAAGKMRSDAADIRVLDRLGNQLSYFIEPEAINTAATQIWIKTDSIKGYNHDTLYVFYGNSSASSLSNGAATFVMFDDFSGSSLSSLWSVCGTSPTVNSGKVFLGKNKTTLTSSSLYNHPLLIEYLIDSLSGTKSAFGVLNNSSQGYSILTDNGTWSLASVSGSSCFSATAFGSTATSGKGKWSFGWPAGGSQIATSPANSISGTGSAFAQGSSARLLVAQFDTTGMLVLDRLMARKYTSTMPTASIGMEAGMVYTISPGYNNPLCEGQTLQLTVDSIAGATYKWTGPGSFSSVVRNPVIPAVTSANQGLYTITVEIPSGCASKSSSVNVSVIPKAVGGTLNGSASVCGGANNGSMTLVNFTGNIIRWDSAQSTTGPWYPINKTSQNSNYNNLQQTTHYRAIVQNGNCSLDSSSIATITVTAPTVGGSISGSDSVCETGNSGVLTLSSYTGSVLRWEYSENGFLWTTISNPSTSQSYSGLTKTRYYRAVVKNGICNEERSSAATITVEKQTVGGTAGPDQLVCTGANSGKVWMSSYTGVILGWEYSDNNGSSWNNASSTKDTITFTNLTGTRLYRAYIKNGKCAGAYSSNATITLASPASAGSISGSAEVCSGSASGVLNLVNYVGNIKKWQSSNRTSGWTDISNTTATHYWSSLSDTTFFRVIVGNSTCADDTSTMATIKVNPATQAGYLSGTSSVCETNGSGSLFLSSQVGGIIQWESSANGFSGWSTISNTTDSLKFTGLTAVIYYRTLVKSGVCASAYTSVKQVDFNKKTVAGSLGSDVNVCENSNSGLLVLSGNTGSVQKWQWQKTGSWTDINSTQSSYAFSGLTDSVYFRTIVKNGSCLADTTASVKVKVYENTNGGTLSGPTAVCINAGNIVLKLANHKGTIKEWQRSFTGTGNWLSIANYSDSLGVNVSTGTAYYRVLVQSGNCSQQYSNIFKLNVDSLSIGGAFAGNQQVCEISNYGTLQLQGYRGNISKWQQKSTGNWSDISHTSPVYAWTGLSGTNYFRAIVNNGGCLADTSAMVTVTIDTKSIAGSINGTNRYCINSANGKLVLSGYSGKVSNWYVSPNGTSGWSALSNQTDSLNFSSLTADKYYKTEVKNGVCPVAETQVFFIKIDELSIGGNFASPQQACENNNYGTLSLLNSKGNVTKWQLNNGSGWADIANTTTTYNWNNLSGSNLFRAIVANGICSADTSASVNVKIYTVSVSGTISGPTALCLSSNKTVLKLNGYNGTITDWQWSDNATTGFIGLSITADSIDVQPLKTRYYRTKVKNGVCSEVISPVVALRIDTLSDAGQLTGNAEVCTGVNSGVIKLSGQNGVITAWQLWDDTASAWRVISKVASDRYDFQNLNMSSRYRVEVANGVCSPAYSNEAKVTVWQKSVVGGISGTKTFCNDINAGSINLTGSRATEIVWQTSADNGISWTVQPAKDTIINYANISGKVLFRASVQNGVCAAEYSPVASITAYKPSAAGMLFTSDSVFCDKAIYGSIQTQGSVYTTNKWQGSTDGGSTWKDLAADQPVYFFSNLVQTIHVRHIAANYTCAADTSKGLSITIVPQTISGNISGIQQVCESSGKVVLKLNGYVGKITGWEIAGNSTGPWSPLGWSADSLLISNPVNSAAYRVKLQNGICPSSVTEPFTLKVDKRPAAGVITGDAMVCPFTNQGQLKLAGYSGNQVMWMIDGFVQSDKGETIDYQNISTPLTYKAIVQNGVCTADTSAAFIIGLYPAITPDFTYENACSDALVHFNGTASGSAKSYEWLMSDGFRSDQSTFDRSFLVPGNYQVQLTAISNDDCAFAVSKQITISESPIAHFTYQNRNGDAWACDNDSIWFYNMSMGGDSFRWDVNNGLSSTLINPVFAVTSPGVYTVTLKTTTTAGCTDSTTQTFNVVGHKKVTVVFPASVSKGIPFDLEGPEGYVNYNWQPAALFEKSDVRQGSVTLNNSTVLYLKVTDRYGCSSIDSGLVNTESDFRVIPNNIITPEGNGQNDVWIIANIQNYPDHEIRLYDRWGRMVNQYTQYNNTWNGVDDKGKELPDGTYYYVIDFKSSGKVLKGAITLIRNK